MKLCIAIMSGLFCIPLFAAAWAADATMLHLGILALRPKSQMQQAFQPFVDYMTSQLPGYRVQLHLLDHQEMLAAVQQHQLDFVMTNPSHYITLRQKNALSGVLATLVSLESAYPLSHFGGVIIARSNRNDIHSLSDIREKRIACPGIGADFFGGFAAQSLELYQNGISLEPEQLLITGLPQDNVIQAVLEDRADLGFVRTGLIEQLEQQGKIPAGAFKVIKRQNLHAFPFVSSTRLYPEWPFVALPHVDQRLAAKVAAVLFSTPVNTSAFTAAGIHSFTIPADYQPVEALLRELRLPPFDIAQPLTMKEFWKLYWPWVICFSLFVAVNLLFFCRISARRNIMKALMALEQHQDGLQKANEAVEAANRMLRLLSASNKALVHSITAEEHLFKVCKIAVEIGGYAMAWIGSALRDEEKTILPLAWFGIEEESLNRIKMSWGDAEHGAAAMGAAIRTGTIQVRHDILNDPSMSPWHDAARKLNVMSAVALPLLVNGEVDCALAIYSSEPHAFQQDEVDLLHELALDLAFGIQTIGERQSNEKAREHIHQLAYFDHLTGLPNRSLFQDRLHQAMREATEHGYTLGVMFLDLDGFKEVNDTLGHDTGDELLRIIATRFSKTLRPNDTICRMGGDEFAVLIPEVRREVDLAIIARKLLAAVKAPVTLLGREMFISASIGIASFPSDSRETTELLSYADSAMYHAKTSGKDGFKFYAAKLTETATERMELESDLRKALANGELEVFYQPKVHTIIGQMTGAEALLRWRHPTRGMIPPDKFIGIAEDTGMIIEIGAWVLRTACAAVASWNRESLFPVKVAVNLSVRQLTYSNFVEIVRTTLSDTGCRPEWLDLEITESLLMLRKAETLGCLEALNRMGIDIAIDDFGTGYSSLSYLTEFPIRIIKIDKAFVKDITTDKRKLELARSIILLGRSLGTDMVAEGVETAEQAACLDRLGCYVLQGYYYGKPMPVHEFTAWQNRFSATQRSNEDGMARVIGSAWRDFLTTGHSVIDNQHKELFQRITELTHACRQHEEQYKVSDMLNYLGNYVKVHFATEEKLLLKSASPHYFEHKAAHDYFTDLVHTLLERCRIEGESRELTIKTNYMAMEWLTRHICVMDRELAEHLLAHDG